MRTKDALTEMMYLTSPFLQRNKDTQHTFCLKTLTTTSTLTNNNCFTKNILNLACSAEYVNVYEQKTLDCSPDCQMLTIPAWPLTKITSPIRSPGHTHNTLNLPFHLPTSYPFHSFLFTKAISHLAKWSDTTQETII